MNEVYIEGDGKRLVIVKRNSVHYVIVEEILFIERLKHETLIHTLHECLSVYISLKEIYTYLPACFIRAHKSYIVNKHNLREMTNLNKNTYEAMFSNRKTALVNKNMLDSLI